MKVYCILEKENQDDEDKLFLYVEIFLQNHLSNHVIKMTEGHVREYVKRVASVDIENFPEWDLTVSLILCFS